MNVEIEIAEVMRTCGIKPPRYIVFDGKIHRFGRNKSSWCVFFDGHVKAGAFGDWKTGVNEKFIESHQDITSKDRQRIAQQMREAAAQREREQRIAQERATKDCDMIWIFASTTGDNSYLASKGLPRPISDYGLRRTKEPFGDYSPFDSSEYALVVPVVDIVGAVRSLQFIAPDGRKRFYPGGKLRGHFCPIALTENPEKLLICEGIATALTLYEDSCLPVITAFNANNRKRPANPTC